MMTPPPQGEMVSRKQQLLAELRHAYLAELPERLDDLEQLVLRLAQAEGFEAGFDELYRKTHSLKGSAGTQGVMIVSTICHQLEEVLNGCAGEHGKVSAKFIDSCLAHIDLMRQARKAVLAGEAAPAGIEEALERLRAGRLGSRGAGLLVEASRVNTFLYLNALKDVNIEFTALDNGYSALERLLTQKFDLLVTGHELPTLNGVALIAAVRLAGGVNRDIKAILLSSQHGLALPKSVAPDRIVARDVRVGESLARAVSEVLAAG